MAVIDVALEFIDDNPYNPRKYYPQAKVKEMTQSLDHGDIGSYEIKVEEPLKWMGIDIKTEAA